MSFCPWIRPSRLLHQDFGVALTPNDILVPFFTVTDYYFRPWHLQGIERDLGSTVKMERGRFQITLDVEHFKEDEIKIKTVDGYVVIEGKHEERKDEHGLISRNFVRKYALPDDVVLDSLESTLSSDGVLTISGKRKQEITEERRVPLTQTGPVRTDSTVPGIKGSAESKLSEENKIKNEQ